MASRSHRFISCIMMIGCWQVLFFNKVLNVVLQALKTTLWHLNSCPLQYRVTSQKLSSAQSNSTVLRKFAGKEFLEHQKSSCSIRILQNYFGNKMSSWKCRKRLYHCKLIFWHSLLSIAICESVIVQNKINKTLTIWKLLFRIWIVIFVSVPFKRGGAK